MKFLKWFGLSILSLMLFISLSSFGAAFTAKSTALNPGFVSAEINNLPLSTLGKNLTQDNNLQDLQPEIRGAISQTITDMEPQLKQDLSSATDQVYDYLLGKKPDPELAATLRNTVLSNTLILKFIDNTPVATIAANEVLKNLQNQQIPPDLQPMLAYIQPAFNEAEPQLKAELKDAAPPLLDYLVGTTKTFKISLNLQPVIDNLAASAKAYYTKNPPAELAGIPQSQLVPYIDNFIDQNENIITQYIPATFIINENDLGTGTASDVHQGISNAESALQEARPDIQLFQRYYIYLIIFTILLIAGIILIHRSVKGASRSLGSIFIAYGIIELTAVLINKFYVIPGPVANKLNSVEALPPEVSTFLVNLINHALNYLLWFSLGVLILGIALLVVSFVYRPQTASS